MSCKDRRIHRAERDGLDDLQYGGALDDVVPVVDIRSFGDAMHATIPMFTMGSLHRLISCAKEVSGVGRCWKSQSSGVAMTIISATARTDQPVVGDFVQPQESVPSVRGSPHPTEPDKGMIGQHFLAKSH